MIEVETIFRTVAGELVRADGFPPHAERFERAGYDVAALLAPTGARSARSAGDTGRRALLGAASEWGRSWDSYSVSDCCSCGSR